MALLCGTDIVYIPDMIRVLKEEAVLKKFFQPSELIVPELSDKQSNSNVSLEYLAGVIAAKEAFFKALGMVPKFLDVSIGYEVSGRPKLIVAPEWQAKYISSDLSISHDKNYAIAMVILES